MSYQGLKKNEMNKNIEFLFFKSLPYSEGLSLQRRINDELVNGSGKETVIVCEHNPVYTCGIHHEQSPDDMKDLFYVERGGGITYHGPGQITAYFIFNLNKRGINVLDLINFVHEVEIEYLKLHKINAEPRLKKETGIWAGNQKIASTGFAIKGGITMHGIGLNVNTELSHFSLINPCGYDWSVMTSVSKINNKIYEMENEKKVFLEVLKNKLEMKL